jgi:hypothetical protein
MPDFKYFMLRDAASFSVVVMEAVELKCVCG